MEKDSTPKKDSTSRGAYRLEVRCKVKFLGPVHTGTGERLSAATDAPVLRLPSGEAVLLGSSIRGVFCDWCEREAPRLGINKATFDRLFGITPKKKGGGRDAKSTPTNDRQGRLTVLNTLLPAPLAAAKQTVPRTEIRDHVRIDHRYGSAAFGAKFDEEIVPSESAVLTFVYEGDSKDDEEIGLLHCIIAVLRNKLLAFGGKSGWGYGWAELVGHPEVIETERSSAAGLAKYLRSRLNSPETAAQPDRRFAGEPAPSGNPVQPKKWNPAPWSWLYMRLRLEFDGPTMVAGPDRHIYGVQQKIPDSRFLAALASSNRPILPGASLRGVLRSHAYRIANSLDGREEKKPLGRFQEIAQCLFGFADDAQNDGRQGLVRIGEGSLTGQVKTIWMDHVAIDRITGFAADGKLFNAMALASPRFEVPILLRWREAVEEANAVDERTAVALFLFLLRDAAEGLLWAGARTTRGYGHLKGIAIEEAQGSLATNHQRQSIEITDLSINGLSENRHLKPLIDEWVKWVKLLPADGKEAAA